MSAPLKHRNTQAPVELVFDNASVSGTTTKLEWKAPAGKRLKIVAIDYVNPTGLAADTSNYFKLELKNGTTSIGSWSTLTTAQGSLGAGTFVSLVLSSTATDLVLAGSDILSSVLTKSGTQTLPAGRFVVHANLLD